MITFSRISPDPSLRDYIQGYWYIEDVKEDCVLNLVPDGYPEICFLLEQKVNFIGNEHYHSSLQDGLFGQFTKSIPFHLKKGNRMFMIKLYPWTPHHLFKLPVSETTDRVVPLEDLDSQLSWSEIKTQLLFTLSKMRVKALLDQFFIRQFAKKQSANAFIQYAVQQVFVKHGDLNLDVLNTKINASRRYIEKLFKQHIGVSPKQYAKLIRVKKASLLLLEENAYPNIKSVASSLGYYDYSHFSKDFKSITSFNPQDFLQLHNRPLMDNFEDYLSQWDYS